MRNACKKLKITTYYYYDIKINEYKSSFTLIMKNSPHLKFFTLTPWLTWLTNKAVFSK